MRTLKLITLTLILLALASACGAEPKANAGFTTIAPATLTANDQVAPPSGPVVLSLTGKVGATNGPGRLDFDMETLEKLGMIEFTFVSRLIIALRSMPSTSTMRAKLRRDIAPRSSHWLVEYCKI